MTSKILAPSLFVLLVAGCSNTQSNSAATKVATGTAVRVHGDIIPHKLTALSIPKPTETALLAGSDALAPRKPLDIEVAPDPVIGRDFKRTMQGTDPASFTFPVDAPQGARVIVRTANLQALSSVHIRSLATGELLDLARDPSTTTRVTHTRGIPASPDEASLRALKGGGEARAATPPSEETGFVNALNHRTVSFDLPATAGLVRLEVPPDAAAAGVVMELQQPHTQIALSGVATEHNYALGDNAELTFRLSNGDQPIDGASLTGYGELKDHSATPAFGIVSMGGGVYRATIPLNDTDWNHTGVWGIHVKATGSTGGVAFERDVETAFGYYPAHAQMTAVGVPHVSRGGDGLIDEVAVDVDVESLADDRFSVRGTLTYTGSDGAEHGIASAQTGQTIRAGSDTITLHFSAASMALAKIDGPFHVRDLALVSQAYGFTEHRLGRGLDLVTDSFKSNELRFPRQISIQAQDLIRNGDLEAVR